MTPRSAVLLAACLAASAFAQTTTTAGRSSVTAFGDATVSVKPDQARLNLAVVTTAQTATDAAAKNADSAASMIAALQNVLGPNADIRTISYVVSPTYQTPPGGQPTLTGFSVTNTVQVLTNDTTIIGRLIDAAIQAGANRIDGISFGVKDDAAVRSQALRTAAQNARSKAEAIAGGLGVRLGAVIAAVEGATVIPVASGMGAATPTTPIQPPGALDIRAVVTLQLAIAQ